MIVPQGSSSVIHRSEDELLRKEAGEGLGLISLLAEWPPCCFCFLS